MLLPSAAVGVGRVVIVGAGPAGSALAYLLARRGVEVALLERHSSFERTFRGDRLQPSGRARPVHSKIGPPMIGTRPYRSVVPVRWSPGATPSSQHDPPSLRSDCS